MKNPYSNIPITAWLLAGVSLISRSGSMVLFFLSLYLTQKLGFSIIETGKVLSLYGLGAVLGAYFGGALSDRIGFLRVQTSCLFFVGVSYFLLEHITSKSEFMIVMFIIGLLVAAVKPANAATIARYCTTSERGRAYALNYQAMNIGNTMGPALGGFLASFDYAWIFRVDGFANIMASMAVWLFFKNRRNVTPEENEMSSPEWNTSPWRDKYFLFFLVFVFLIGLCFFQLLNVYPVFLKEIFHITEFEFGLVMGMNGLLIALFQIPLSHHFNRYKLLTVIGAGGFLICLGFFILSFYHGFYYAIFSMAIITFGEIIAMPFMSNFVANISPPKSRGKYQGLFSCVLYVPLLVTPYLSSYVYHTYGSNVLWTGVGLLGVVILMGLNYMRKFDAIN